MATNLAGYLITARYEDTLVYMILASFTHNWRIPTWNCICTPLVFDTLHPCRALPRQKDGFGGAGMLG